MDQPRPAWPLEIDPAATAMASMTIGSEEELAEVVAFLRKAAAEYMAIAGVFPAPVMGVIAGDTIEDTYAAGQGVFSTPTVPVFTAWNIQRPEEGGKPTFQHHKWVHVGNIKSQS